MAGFSGIIGSRWRERTASARYDGPPTRGEGVLGESGTPSPTPVAPGGIAGRQAVVIHPWCAGGGEPQAQPGSAA